MWLAALPLLSGLSIYGLWFTTNDLNEAMPLQPNALALAGIATIWFGVAATVAVLALVPIGWAFAAHAGATVRQCLAPAALALSLTISSYPVAWFCLDSWIAHATKFVVTVHNDGDSPWGDLHLVGPGVDDPLGTLLPKSTLRRHVWFAGDGPFVLRETTATGVRSHEIEGYVCRRLGGSANVLRGDDGMVRVIRPDLR